MDAQMIVKRQQLAESNRQVVEQQWELIREYVVPFRGQFFKEQQLESAVEWRENRRVFDSTASDACNILASSLHGAITNPSIQWFDFTFLDQALKKDKQAMEWAYNASQTTFQALRDSNFNLEVNEAYIDFSSFGTAITTKEVLENSDNSFNDFLFQGVPLVESFFEQDHRGRNVIYYRKMRWSAVMILDKFGDEATPDNIKEKAKGGNSQDMDINIIFCVYKRDLGQEPDITKVLTPENRPYGYKYVLADSKEQIGDEGGYYYMPALNMRWRKTADSMWGNSPAHIALPDILTLNELVELTLNSLEKVVDPALLVTERGLLSQLDLGAAGVNVVRSMNDIAPFESRARFDVADLKVQQLQGAIRRVFYVDQLEMKESPAMTATEVQVRYELMQRLLGPTLGRIESDFLDPLVMTSFADLMRYGKIPGPPQSVLNSGNPKILVRYTGPMARAQRLDQVASLERYAAGIANLAEIKPDIVDVPDWDMIARNMAKLHGIDPDNVNSETEVKRTRGKREDQAARMQEAEIEEQEGNAEQAMQAAVRGV
jgi:hypothetical protein